MDNREVASLVFESLDLTVKVVNEYTHAAFFSRADETLCAEVFNGRRSAELYSEYGHWLFYITDIYLPCCDSESGDFRHLPFAGNTHGPAVHEYADPQADPAQLSEASA